MSAELEPAEEIDECEDDPLALDVLDLTEDELTREEYAWARTAGLIGVGAVMLYMGHNHDEMPHIFHTEIGGTPAIGWFRHVFPAVLLTAASEWYLDGSDTYAPRPLRWIPGANKAFGFLFRNEKLSSFTIGFVPSVFWESWQYSNGGIFGVADLVAAAGAGAVTLAMSTKEVPMNTPKRKPLLKVRYSANID